MMDEETGYEWGTRHHCDGCGCPLLPYVEHPVKTDDGTTQVLCPACKARAVAAEEVDEMDHGTKWSVGGTGGEHEEKCNLLDESLFLAKDMEITKSMLERFEEQFTEPEREALEDLVDHAQERLDMVKAKLLGERICSGCGEAVEGECWSMAYNLTEAGWKGVLLLCSRCMPEIGEGNLGKEGYVFF